MSKKTKKKKTQKKPQQWPLILIAAVAILIIAAILISRFNTNNDLSILASEGPSETSLPLEISSAQTAQMQMEGALIVDVREQSEWIEGHIDGAVLIPLGELESRLNELPKDKEIITVCRTGRRSAEARDILLNNGFAQVTSMAGGMTAWVKAGYSIVTGK